MTKEIIIEIIKKLPYIKELEARVKKLEDELYSGVSCEYCNNPNTKVTDIKDHPAMGELLKVKTFLCLKCEKSFDKDYDKL